MALSKESQSSEGLIQNRFAAARPATLGALSLPESLYASCEVVILTEQSAEPVASTVRALAAAKPTVLGADRGGHRRVLGDTLNEVAARCEHRHDDDPIMALADRSSQ